MGCRGFGGMSSTRLLKDAGTRGQAQHQAIKALFNAAERASQWLWIKKKEGWHLGFKITSKLRWRQVGWAWDCRPHCWTLWRYSELIRETLRKEGGHSKTLRRHRRPLSKIRTRQQVKDRLTLLKSQTFLPSAKRKNIHPPVPVFKPLSHPNNFHTVP